MSMLSLSTQVFWIPLSAASPAPHETNEPLPKGRAGRCGTNPLILALGRASFLRNNTLPTSLSLEGAYISCYTMSTIMSSRTLLRTLARSSKLQHRSLSTTQSCLARKHPNGYAPPAREDLEELRERTREFARKFLSFS
jgi:hypothetical protein